MQFKNYAFAILSSITLYSCGSNESPRGFERYKKTFGCFLEGQELASNSAKEFENADPNYCRRFISSLIPGVESCFSRDDPQSTPSQCWMEDSQGRRTSKSEAIDTCVIGILAEDDELAFLNMKCQRDLF